MTLLDAALEYHAQGLHPIPVEPKGKRPLVKWADFQQTQPTVAQLVDWWTNTPDANVALVLGRGVMAVDIDGPEGQAALEAAKVEFDFDAPVSATGKGRHIFLRGETGDRIGLLPKVDIRGVGYVVAPPSVHPTGKRYEWVVPMAPLAEIPEAPAELMTLIRAAKGPEKPTADGTARSWLVEAAAGVGEGRRDDTCTRLVGYLLAKGMPPEAVYELLLGWAARCNPPLPAEVVQKCVESIAKREGAPEVAPPADIAELMPKVIARLKAGTVKLQSTEMELLDKQLDGGFSPGEYIILGARPGVGKTALALQLAARNAAKGRGVFIVSREMSRENLLRRMLCQKSFVPFQNLKSGQLDELEWRRIESAAKSMAELPIWISNLVSIDQLKEAVEGFKDGEIQLLIVDYLQLLRAPAEWRQDKRGAIEHISKELRTLTIQTRIPLLCLSSLARPPRDMPRWRPSLVDLRESGELEHDADIVLLMHRDAGAEEAELNVAKNRDGRVGMVRLKYDGEVLSFRGENE